MQHVMRYRSFDTRTRLLVIMYVRHIFDSEFGPHKSIDHVQRNITQISQNY